MRTLVDSFTTPFTHVLVRFHSFIAFGWSLKLTTTTTTLTHSIHLHHSNTTANAARDPLRDPSPVPHWHTSVFMLMPLRLGLDKLNPEYLEPLVRALRIKQCVGMIGGKPAHSLFFVGSQGTNLLYLDPHTVQPAAIEHTVAETKAAADARRQSNCCAK
jgi:hypothetical protein